ncbi:AMP-binding protein [Sphingomonas cavernae]|uniref:AMP-binding protein n=1 Tax=Sphingomonas cavernae TaxID=2320861 RepID=UPI00160172A7|nr:AMP-binding protein [Sphingomonas cavernae]
MASRFPDRIALSEPGCAYTFRELNEITDKAAAAFLGLGLRPLDRIIFQVPNCKELVVALIACFKAGLIPICTLTAHRALEIGYIGHHAAATAHFVPGDDPKFDFVAFSNGMRSEIPSLNRTVVLRGEAPAGSDAVALETLIAGQDLESARQTLADVELDPFQVAVFQLSGGTTGVPKIIPRFNNEYLYTMRTVIDFHGLDETTVALTPAPMVHNAPMICIWGPSLFAGGEVVAAASLDPAVLGPLIVARRPNWFLLPIPILLRLQETGWLDQMDLSEAKGFITTVGAAKLSAMVDGAPAWPIFGMTEGLVCFCNESDSAEAVNDSVGRQIDPHDELRILAFDSDEELPDGAIGELAIRGPCTIRGYYDAPERNAEAFTVDGFYRSGDMMRFQTIGDRRYLMFEGRVKDVVDRGGEKINCEEVERICLEHTNVAAIAIVAMPDAAYGQRACAYIIPPAGSQAPTVQQLAEFLGARGMAKFKWPERIEVVSEFPMTSSGKLSKPKLREMIAEKIA